jgi:drug/metabolite transporter (DMT)-like permease
MKTDRIAGYAFALAAGSLWGTTGPLSTLLYARGAALTGIGFWRILIGTVGLAVLGAATGGSLFRIDRRGLVMVGLGGGALVALFEVAYQFGIAGAGVAGAAALLYTAPVLVTLLARPLLGEALTPLRLALAVVVMVGATLAVTGGSHAAGGGGPPAGASLAAGVAGGVLAAASYAGTTLLARWGAPRYGVVRLLFWEILGGTVLLAVILPLAGHTPVPPPTPDAWAYTLVLTLFTVWLANFAFFAAARRIEAGPTAVTATIEPVVGALLAYFLLGQLLTGWGWLGLVLVVGGVAAGYWREAFAEGGSA